MHIHINLRQLAKIFTRVLIALVVVYLIAFTFLAVAGRDLLAKKLTRLSQRKVTMEYCRLIPPFTLKIKNLNIEGLASAKYVYISYYNIFELFSNRILLNNIRLIMPTLYYEHGSEDTTKPGFSLKPAKESVGPKKKVLRIIFQRVKIEDGRFEFIDRTAGQEGIKVKVINIDFTLNNFYVFPFSLVTKFSLKGNIPWQQGTQVGSIEANGWLDLVKKDMQARLNISDIDGIYLYPYYAKWVDLEKSRIEKAKLNFSSNIQGLDNSITANCRLELTEIVFRPLLPDEKEEKAQKIAYGVLDIFKSMNEGKIILDFTIHTKMDKPEFGFGDIKLAFEDRLSKGRGKSVIKPQDLLVLPGKLIEGTFKGAAELSKALVDSSISIGREIKIAVEEAFKKEFPQPENVTVANNTTAK